jgi:hypothetical protein
MNTDLSTTDPCPFAAHPAHAGPCAELNTFVAEMRSQMYPKLCQSCPAPAAWEVPFTNAPHYEYYCDTCMPSTYYVGSPVAA